MEPRWSFFIFADQDHASVDSGVDHTGEDERRGLGCCYFNVVRRDLITSEAGAGPDDLHFDDEECRNLMEETRRKIKVHDFVDLVIYIFICE
jgi:hypothetical protein